jgi:hypothetical protein
VPRAGAPPSEARDIEETLSTWRFLAVAMLLSGCVLDLRGTEWKKPGAMFPEVSLVETACARNAFLIGPGPI